MTLNQLKYVIEISKQNSINEAAKSLFISQPSLTAALKSLEQEVGFDIFTRTNSGITLTVKGEEFLGYAKSVVEQYDILDAKYISKSNVKRTFQVSMQHYTFALNAFINVIKQYGMDEYEFEVHETRTYDVIDNVRSQKSEIGVLYMNDYNRTVLEKILRDAGLKFTPLFDCSIYAYMSKSNPLANKKYVTMKDLDDYPCVAFSQGEHNSFYFAEEVMSTYEYKRLIRVSDRATILNMMVGLNGYTLCSGIICEDLNGTDYCAVKLKTKEKMTIGYISRKHSKISEMGQKYVEELSKYKEMVLD
ncbi:DNA-binding transcriptional regulator, LysR family [Lachnospiraceae bacterium NE2001]|nr:DNA-binding transcriptional regulator, LysR family [Lachnospiraceae bacterium NE2001]